MITKDNISGLNNEEVLNSRKKYGKNIITQIKKKNFIKILIGNFNDPMLKILIFALAINCVFLISSPNYLEIGGIAFAIFLAVFISTLSELGSESAFKKLQQNIAMSTAKVRRNKKTLLIPIDQIVVGDIILLASGDKICADGILISGCLEVDQATLNGEAKEAKKEVIDKSLTKMSNDLLHPQSLFNGTIVSGGEGIMEVKAIGDNSSYGKLARGLQEKAPASPLKEKLEHLATRISRFGYIGAFLVFISYLLNAIVLNNTTTEMIEIVTNFNRFFPLFIKALTLAVSVMVMSVPEGLPMMITVVLAINTRRMLKDKVLVRKMNSIDTAGTLNILFTDKTGTLTNGHLAVSDIIVGQAIHFAPTEFKKIVSLTSLTALSLIYNNGAELSEGKAIGGNATDRCLLEYGKSISQEDLMIINKGRIPFSSKLKYMATSVAGDFSGTLIKGAPEKIIDKCSYFYDIDGKKKELKDKKALFNQVEKLNTQAIRTIAIATSEQSIADNYLNQLCLVAIIGIHDEIRAEANGGVKQVQGAGIQVVMITGDALKTAEAIAIKTGIIANEDDIIMNSEQLGQLSDQEVLALLPKIKIIARAKPEDKLRLVKLAQKADLIVGMTGDGVNDAPALKCADVGFAMGSGMDISKEASDIIITDDNFLSVAKAIVYGRTIFKNIRKFIVFQLTINFCAVIVSIVAPLLNIEMPISVVQMLWINLVIDTLAGMAFGGERPRSSYMLEAPKKRKERIINSYMWQQIIVTTIYCCIISIFFLKIVINHGLLANQARNYKLTAYFSLFMFMAIFNSLNARTHKINLIDYLVLNKQFVWVMGGIALIQIALIYYGQIIFETVPLSFNHLVIIIFLAFTIIPLDLLRKSLNKAQSGT